MSNRVNLEVTLFGIVYFISVNVCVCYSVYHSYIWFIWSMWCQNISHVLIDLNSKTKLFRNGCCSTSAKRIFVVWFVVSIKSANLNKKNYLRKKGLLCIFFLQILQWKMCGVDKFPIKNKISFTVWFPKISRK